MIEKGKEILAAWMSDRDLRIQTGLMASALALVLTASVRPVNEATANAAEVLPVAGQDLAFAIDTLDGHVSLERVASYMSDGDDHHHWGAYPHALEAQEGDTDITAQDFGEAQMELYEVED